MYQSSRRPNDPSNHIAHFEVANAAQGHLLARGLIHCMLSTLSGDYHQSNLSVSDQ